MKFVKVIVHNRAFSDKEDEAYCYVTRDGVQVIGRYNVAKHMKEEEAIQMIDDLWDIEILDSWEE